MPGVEPQLTTQTLKLLGAFMSSATEEMSGAEVGRITKLPSGTLYPILIRLEKAGWLASRWEEGDPASLGRPRRRFYHITGLGVRKAQSAVADVAANFGKLSWT